MNGAVGGRVQRLVVWQVGTLGLPLLQLPKPCALAAQSTPAVEMDAKSNAKICWMRRAKRN